MTHSFLWFDLETTGLDEHTGRILEWAVALAHDGPGGNMAIAHEWSAVVHYPVAELNALPIDKYVMKMHTDNGLWHEIEQSTTTIAESDEFLDELCVEISENAAVSGLVLAGNSVHFDLRWVREHLPRFAKRLSYRVFDVRTLLSAEAEWGSPIEALTPAHRARDDVRASIAYAAAIRRRRYP